MSFARVFAFSLLLPVLSPAQSAPMAAGAPAGTPADAIASSFGVSVHAGVPHAGGPRYSVRFLPSGPVYTPLLGRSARASEPGPVDLQFTFLEARVGDAVLARGGDESPQVSGQQVAYARGALVETYEALRDGVEQSFVLAERPAVAGDLVVRGRITTALPLVANGDDEVRFALPCGAGVSFGAVTGIDANGVTVRGSMRCRGYELELSLPASFVQSARYPLVLDPLVGTAFVVGDDPLHTDFRPAIAYDETTSRFLVVWAVFVPATPTSIDHTEIRGQFVVPGGGTVGTQVVFSVLGGDTSWPQVANVNLSNRFLVTWNEATSFLTDGLVCRAISATNGALSNLVAVNQSLGVDVYGEHHGLGGDSRTGLFGGSHALIAYQFQSNAVAPVGTNYVQVRRIQVPSTGDPVVEPSTTVGTSSNRIAEVAVSAHCGSAGRWLIAFGQNVVAATGPMQRVVAQVVGASGTLCGTSTTMVNHGAGGDVGRPAIATRDGNEFVVAWQDNLANVIELRRLVVSGACGSTTVTADPILNPLTNPGQAVAPALAFVKDKYLLVYQQYQSGWRVFTRALDPATCATCGLEQRVDAPVLVAGQPAVGSAWHGGDTTSENALVAWCDSGAVKARHWTVHGTPSVVGLGGGCGISGLNDFATYDGQPQLGDSTFAATLLNPTAPVLGLIVGFSQVAVPCGPCTLVAAPDVVLAAAGTVPIPIPCDANLIGAELYTQWLQFRSSGCPIVPTLSVSNGLKFTIAE